MVTEITWEEKYKNNMDKLNGNKKKAEGDIDYDEMYLEIIKQYEPVTIRLMMELCNKSYSEMGDRLKRLYENKRLDKKLIPSNKKGRGKNFLLSYTIKKGD